jgi:hypothetical protein
MGTHMHTPPSTTTTTTTTTTNTNTTTAAITFNHDTEKIERVAVGSGMRSGGQGEEQQNAAGAANGLRVRHAFDVQQEKPNNDPTPASCGREWRAAARGGGGACLRGSPGDCTAHCSTQSG